MSMTGNYVAVTDDMLENLKNGETDVWDLIGDDAFLSADIDKAWDALRYTLTGEIHEGEPPLGWVVPLFIENIIDADSDYGIFYLTPDMVQTVNEAISAIDENTFCEMFDIEAMKEDEVYPIVTDEDPAEFFDYIYAHFSDLQKFFKQADKAKLNVVFFVS